MVRRDLPGAEVVLLASRCIGTKACGSCGLTLQNHFRLTHMHTSCALLSIVCVLIIDYLFLPDEVSGIIYHSVFIIISICEPDHTGSEYYGCPPCKPLRNAPDSIEHEKVRNFWFVHLIVYKWFHIILLTSFRKLHERQFIADWVVHLEEWWWFMTDIVWWYNLLNIKTIKLRLRNKAVCSSNLILTSLPYCLVRSTCFILRINRLVVVPMDFRKR